MDIHAYEPLWGRWKVEQLIGRGSYGSVYLCTRSEFGNVFTSAVKHISIPQDEAEIKSARLEGMNEESLKSYFSGIAEDFISEIKLMNSLKGLTNVVSIEDYLVERREDGVSWDILIRMEYLTSLNEYMQTHVLTQGEILQLGIDIAHAIVECQQSKVIHRDIKPDNIFISERGDFKLGDFGIARRLERTKMSMSQKGTFSYMAPEIYKGQHYDARVDIYSLGLVLYRLLNNNRLPFMPPYPDAITYRAREEALTKRLSGAALPPPANADAKLAAVVQKACAFRPSERYQTPGELMAALEALQETGKTIKPRLRTFDAADESPRRGAGDKPSKGRADDKTVGLFPDKLKNDREKVAFEQTEAHAKEHSEAYRPSSAKAAKAANAPVSKRQRDYDKTIGLMPDMETGKGSDPTIGLFPDKLVAAAPKAKPVAREPEENAPTARETSTPSKRRWLFAPFVAAVGLLALVALICTDTVFTIPLFIASALIILLALLLTGAWWVNVFFVPHSKKSTSSVLTKLLSTGFLGCAVVAGALIMVVAVQRSPIFDTVDREDPAAEAAMVLSPEPILALMPTQPPTPTPTATPEPTPTPLTMAPGFMEDNAVTLSAGAFCSVGLREDGSVIAASLGDAQVMEDGSIYAENVGTPIVYYVVADWKGVVSISAGGDHVIGLKSDGTVVAAGKNGFGQCDVSEWTDIVAIAAGVGHTVGLKNDGTVVAAGWNDYVQCDVSDWTNIRAVSAGWGHTIGLKSNGRVVSIGLNNDSEYDVSGWTDIVAISAGNSHSVGLKHDGTVVATGDNFYGQCKVSKWRDIVAITAGHSYTIGLKSDGTVVATGYYRDGQCNVSGWTDIVAIAAGHNHTLGLKSDGTVIATGDNDYGQRNVSGWTDIRISRPKGQ